MQEVYEFLKKCGTYYLATVDGDQPRSGRLEQWTFSRANSISRRAR